MSVIPPPPISADGSGRIRVTVAAVRSAMAGGVYGTCCMCQTQNSRWLDLSRCAIDPVLDEHGTLTDQVSVHDRCVIALVSHWWDLAGVLDADPDVDDAPCALFDRPAPVTASGDRTARMGGVYAR